MKINIFIENNQNGGLDTFCYTLINHWPNSNDSFRVICNDDHPGKLNLKNAIKPHCEFYFHRIPLSWTITKKILFFFPPAIRKAFHPFLRIFLLPLQSVLIRNIFRKIGGDELIVVNGGFPGGESCRLANIVWHSIGRKPSIHNFHNYSIKPRFGFRWYENWLDRKLLKSTKLFISVSKSCSDSLRIRDTFKAITNSKYIYNGIWDDSLKQSSLNLRKELHIGENPLCIMLGTYEPRKGHSFIFKAFEKVSYEIPNAHLVVCGGGSKHEINKVTFIKNDLNNSNNVHLMNFIQNGAELINQADLLLIGSQEFESFGLTAVEAMIRKKAVVATNIGGLPEVIGLNDACGYIVNHEDIDGFAEKVIFLLKEDKLRIKMGKKGRERAIELFHADRMAKDYLLAIEE